MSIALRTNMKKYLRDSNEIEDVTDDQAHRQADEAWRWLRNQTKLSHSLIKEVHTTLLEHRQPDIAGDYRDQQVYVGNYEAPPADQVKDLMTTWINADPPKTSIDLLKRHIEFERIHPFPDGNGRVGRLLYAWEALQIGLEPIHFTPDNIKGYYDLFLHETDHPDLP